MDWPEAVSFRLLEDYLANLLPASVGHHLLPYFEQARRRLSARQSGAAMKDWPDKVRVLTPGPSLVEPVVKKAVHDAVSDALLGNQQLEIDYRSVGSPQPKRHVINPLGLVMEGRTMYLVASYPRYDEPRRLALHRMERAVPLSSASVPPQGFSLNSYIESGGFGCGGTEQITLDATWHECAGIHLIQSKLASDQVVKELDSDTTRIRAKVLYTERLVWWLLSFGDRVEVHGPRKLREEIARSHRAAARRYAKSTRRNA
jgi:predicted DNA-binding transcriptional regulator YafY